MTMNIIYANASIVNDNNSTSHTSNINIWKIELSFVTLPQNDTSIIQIQNSIQPTNNQ